MAGNARVAARSGDRAGDFSAVRKACPTALSPGARPGSFVLASARHPPSGLPLGRVTGQLFEPSGAFRLTLVLCHPPAAGNCPWSKR